MRYEEPVFRPPSEANSLLIQATLGCSHNRCRFCAMYQQKSFRVRPMNEILEDLREGLAHPGFRRVFLCDGDALVLHTDKLLTILSEIKQHGPHIQRVGVYGDALAINRKSVDELTALREAGLGIVYHGMESGDNETLALLNKGVTDQEIIQAARKLREAGIAYSAIVLLGAGGEALSEQHAKNTARVLSACDPDYVGCLMLTLVPGTPMHDDAEAGRFTLPGPFGLLEELRTLVAESHFSNCHFTANHASNYLPLKGDFPADQPRILDLLNRVLQTKDRSILKPEWMRGL